MYKVFYIKLVSKLKYIKVIVFLKVKGGEGEYNT